MYDFNLLPSPYQKRTKQWMISRYLNHGLLLINIVLLLIAGTLAVLNFSLHYVVTAYENSRLSLNQYTNTSRSNAKEIQQVNTLIQQLSFVQKQHTAYMNVLSTISNTIPDGVSTEQIFIDYEKKEIAVTGIAESRTTLQNFQQHIEDTAEFHIIDFPFDALTQSAHIPFTITLEFDETILNTPLL